MRDVGIDLHKRLLVASIVDQHGQVVAKPRIEEVTRKSLLEFCRQHLHPRDHVALEVTIRQLDCPYEVLSPRGRAWLRRSSKATSA